MGKTRRTKAARSSNLTIQKVSLKIIDMVILWHSTQMKLSQCLSVEYYLLHL